MRFAGLVVVFALSFLLGHAETVLLYDFEDGTEGWVAEWGLTEPLETTSHRSRSGDHSLEITHHFKRGQEGIGLRVLFAPAEDYSVNPSFVGFSAWVFFQALDGWEAQMYVHSDNQWTWGEGALLSGLQPGWHRVTISKEQIADLSHIHSIGVQIKNYKHQRKATISIDRVEAIYASD